MGQIAKPFREDLLVVETCKLRPEEGQEILVPHDWRICVVGIDLKCHQKVGCTCDMLKEGLENIQV